MAIVALRRCYLLAREREELTVRLSAAEINGAVYREALMTQST